MPRRQTSRRGAKEINSVSNDEREHSRALAGATVLQIVPALREEPAARTALNVAAALREIGARALVAAEDGPLVAELTASGGEWVPLVNATVNPFQLRRSARTLQRLIASERIVIVHAQSAGGAWIANMAASHTSVLLVTTLPDVPPASRLRAYWEAGLARGDSVITPSNFAAAPMIARHKISRERLTIIPRSIDLTAFDPAAVDPARIAALRNAWRIVPAARILLVLGRVVAQAQAMGRPVVTSDIGILPEHVVAPPEMPEEVRTGWVVKPGDAKEFARALNDALSLDDAAYRTMAARARHFAEYMFAPH